MPACPCQHATTELLACRGAPQQHRQTSILHRLTTDQHASMTACHLPGCWYVCNARVHPSSTNMPTFFVLVPRWLAINQHASMPTTGVAGMLGCTLAAQTDQDSWPPLPRWLAINQHASMPACHDRRAGMLGCTLAAQTDQHSCPPFLAGWHRPACQHDSMPQLGVPACLHASARVHASTGMPSIRGCTRGCWPCGHSPR